MGVAAYTTTAFQLNVGDNQSITAVYGGGANYDTSASGVLAQSVSKDATTTSATVAPGSAAIGQTVTFTATVTANSPGAGTPTGTVDFFDMTTNTDLTPGGVALAANGTAAFATASLPRQSRDPGNLLWRQ